MVLPSDSATHPFSLNLTPFHLASDVLPIAGRIGQAKQNWHCVTQDPWVLGLLNGYRLELISTPKQWRPPKVGTPSREQSASVGVEISKLLEKGAVKEVGPVQGQFISSIFTVPKRGGASRPVVNLKPLNKFVIRRRFKMESMATLRELLKENDWMTSVDLKDAFLSVPIHSAHRKLLRFRWQGRLYEFQCLPFGLTSAPRIFTKLMKPVMAILRRRSIRCMIFIDDILLLSQSREELFQITQEFAKLLGLLGFLVNADKSIMTPCQSLTYLGFMVDSVQMTLTLPMEKLELIIQDCCRALAQPQVPVRDLARIIGRMSATTQAILPAPLHYHRIV